MRNLFELRQGVIDDIANNMPVIAALGNVVVKPHAGKFESKELKSIGAKAPCIFISTGALGGIDSDALGDYADIAFAAIIVTKDKPGIGRDEAAMLLANFLAVHLTDNHWGMDEVRRPPEKVNGRNLYSTALKENAVAMWGFTWSQWMTIGGISDSADFDQFLNHTGVSSEGENVPTTNIDTTFQ